MNDRLELEIGYEVDNVTLKSGMEQSKRTIEGVGQTADDLKRKVEANLNSMAVNATKAKSSFNVLSNSINQMSRELPAFTFSAQTGFISLSNNIPIFADAISQLRMENQRLIESGQKGVPVWKQVVSSLFSWQTAMSLAITLLTIYGKELGTWIKGLVTGQNAVDNLKKSEENLNDVRKNANKGYSDSIAKLQTYLSIAKEEKNSMEARQDAVKKLIDLDKERLKGITLETIKTGEATSAINAYTEALRRQAMEKAVVDKRAEITSRQLEAQLDSEKILSEAIEAEVRKRNQKFKFDPDEETATDAKAKRKYQDYLESRKKIKEIQKEANSFDKTIGNLLGGSTGVETKDQNKRDGAYFRNIISMAEKELDGLDKLSKDFPKKSAELKTKILNAKKELEAFSIPTEISQRDFSSSYDRTIDIRKEALLKISDLDKEYARKSMQSDEAEIQALKDKFQKLREVLEKANIDITSRNARNLGKKGYKQVPLFDISELDEIEKRANSQILYDQETTKLEKDLDLRKKIFSDYEDYRNKVGKEKADERFASELDGYENYLQYVKSIQDKNSDTLNAVENRTGTEGQEKRAKLIDKANKEAIDIENKKQVELLALMITYDQKRLNLISKYNAKRAIAQNTATEAELIELDKNHAEELKNLDDANIQKLQSYKNLFSGIEDLSIASAKEVIQNARLLLKADNLSDEERRKILKGLKDAEESISGRVLDQVSKVAYEFDGMAQSVGLVNGELGSTLGLVSNVLRSTISVASGIKDLKKGLSDFSLNKQQGGGGLLGTISGVAGVAGSVGQIVGAVSSVVSGVINFFKAAKESARQASEEIKKYQESIISGELEYNRILRERARIQGNINDSTLNELKQQQALLDLQLKQKQLREITYTDSSSSIFDRFTGANKRKQKEMLSDYEYALKKLQTEGLQVTGQRTEKYGGFLGIGKKTRVVDVTANLAGKTYEDLEKLYTEGKLTESTKALFENLRKAKEEVDDINGLMKEIDEAIKDKMSGGLSVDSISNPIIQGLKDGKRAVKDFAEYSEDIVKEALLSAMNATVLEEPLIELVKKFREDSKDGLSKEEIDSFQKAYSEVVQQGIDAVKEIEKLTGKQFAGSNNSGMSGRINPSITESTGNAIVGFERARYDLAKKNLEAVMQILDFDKKSNEQIIQSIRHLKAIEENTANMVLELKNVKVVLESINNNTGNKGRTMEGMGL